MAFQSSPLFFQFLHRVARSPVLGESAPAENFILDERVPAVRERDFLTAYSFVPRADLPIDDWFQHHKRFATERLRFPPSRVSQTFDLPNQENWLVRLHPDWDVVRVETLDGLCGRGTGAGIPEEEVRTLIEKSIEARNAKRSLGPDDEASLETWLAKVNLQSDHRATFVSPFAEVEKLLEEPDWANRLRDALGLGHIQPRTGRPRVMVLMQYNLDRVFHAHRGHPAWAACPTVLDDVLSAGPNPCFFPAPQSSSAHGFGFTIDLAPPGDFCREFLHARIAYRLDDIRRIGEVTTALSDDDITRARARHRDLLAGDLRFLKDLPSRP